jgi:hypothetical protein
MTAQARWRAALPACDTATLVWLVAAALLAMLTLLAFTQVRQFDVVESPWPFDRGFATLADGSAPARAAGEEPQGWQVEGDRGGVTVADGVLRLRNADPEAGIGIRQVWRLQPGGPRTFKLSADVGSENIKGSRKGFRVGEITLVADRDIARPYFLNMHRLARRDSTRPMERFVATFHFGHQAEWVELAVRLRHATGELRVANLKIVAMGERPLFRQVRLALALAWAAMMATGLYLFGRGIDHRRSALALGAAGLAGAGLLLMPENLRERVLEGGARVIPYHLVASDFLAAAGHFLIFAAAGLLVRLSRRKDPWLGQLALLVALAGLLELLQYFAELRTPTLDDWVTNALGAILGWSLGMAWLWWRQDGQFATQRRSSTTLPPHPAKQRL